jgi:opacity protein-like surface antigen
MKFFVNIFFGLLIMTIDVLPMSFFSSAQQGVGLRQYITHVRGMGMGGTGLALPNFTSLNAYNISLWRYITNTKVTALMRYDINQTDLGLENFTSSTSNFAGVQLAIPLIRYKWVMGLSFTPYTLIDFAYTDKFTNLSQPYEENIFYRGSISRVQLNTAWSIFRRLGIGLSFNYYLGTILDRYYLIFNNPEYYENNLGVDYFFRGPGVSLSSDFALTDSLFLGGFVDFKPSIELIKNSIIPTSGIVDETRLNSSFPLHWGVGASYSYAKNWTISLDYVFQNWSKGFDLENLNLNVLDDWYTIGLGIEHGHSWERRAPFLKKFDKRIGFSTGKIGYKFNEESVKEYTLHLGLGFPFNQNRARLDIALLAGIRGNKSDINVQERFYRFLFSISAGELWFQNLR